MNKKTASSWLSALKKTFSTSKPISSSPSLIPKMNEKTFSSSPEMTRFQSITEAADPQAPRALLTETPCRIDSAATKIQTAFRGYLARRALRSLKALVKLQALVRGYYVRRRTQVTLRCLFSLLRIQGRARRRRLVAESPSPGVIWAGRNIDRSAVHHAEYFPRHVLAAGQSTRGYNEYSTKTSEYSRSTTEVLLENYIEKNGDTGKISGRSNGSSGSVCDRQPCGGIEGSSTYHPKIERDLLSLKTEVLNRRRLSPRKLVNCHNNNSSLRYQPPPSSTLKTKLAKPSYKNQNRIQLTSEYSHQISPPAAPNYMAFTQSAKARRLTTACTRVPSSACSPSSRVNLHEGSFLPPIRTRRSSFPLVDSDL